MNRVEGLEQLLKKLAGERQVLEDRLSAVSSEVDQLKTLAEVDSDYADDLARKEGERERLADLLEKKTQEMMFAELDLEKSIKKRIFELHAESEETKRLALLAHVRLEQLNNSVTDARADAEKLRDRYDELSAEIRELGGVAPGFALAWVYDLESAQRELDILGDALTA